MDIAFCEQTANIWKVVGEVLDIIRIIIPLIIILLGMLDLGKIVLSGDNKAMKESQKMFIKRLIYGLAIFFVATIVKLVFSLVGMNMPEGENAVCWICASKPNSEECTKYADKIIKDNATKDTNDNEVGSNNTYENTQNNKNDFYDASKEDEADNNTLEETQDNEINNTEQTN